MREITKSDCYKLAQIHAHSFDNHWNEIQFYELLVSGAKGWLIEDTAFILTRSAADEVEIITLATHPIHRRNGYAEKLVMRSIRELKQKAYSVMFLEVGEHNIAAQSLYQKLGFHQAAIRPDYYSMPDGTRKDALVMKLNLIQSNSLLSDA